MQKAQEQADMQRMKEQAKFQEEIERRKAKENELLLEVRQQGMYEKRLTCYVHRLTKNQL